MSIKSLNITAASKASEAAAFLAALRARKRPLPFLRPSNPLPRSITCAADFYCDGSCRIQ
jgi:hypothetical protein